MNSSLLILNWKDVAGALITAVFVAVLGYIVSIGDLWKLSGHAIANIAAMAGAVSLLKDFATDSNGQLLGMIKVK